MGQPETLGEDEEEENVIFSQAQKYSSRCGFIKSNHFIANGREEFLSIKLVYFRGREASPQCLLDRHKDCANVSIPHVLLLEKMYIG